MRASTWYLAAAAFGLAVAFALLGYLIGDNLGLDQVLVYRFDAAKGTLAPNAPPFARTAAGAGPRHFAFHPSGAFAYAINELDSTVTAFRYDAGAGALAEIQVVPTLPPGFTVVSGWIPGLVGAGSAVLTTQIAAFAAAARAAKVRPTEVFGATGKRRVLVPMLQYSRLEDRNSLRAAFFVTIRARVPSRSDRAVIGAVRKGFLWS